MKLPLTYSFIDDFEIGNSESLFYLHLEFLMNLNVFRNALFIIYWKNRSNNLQLISVRAALRCVLFSLCTEAHLSAPWPIVVVFPLESVKRLFNFVRFLWFLTKKFENFFEELFHWKCRHIYGQNWTIERQSFNTFELYICTFSGKRKVKRNRIWYIAIDRYRQDFVQHSGRKRR